MKADQFDDPLYSVSKITTWRDANGGSVPITELHYYDGTATNLNDRGRLQKVVQYPGATTSACGAVALTTT